MDDTMHARLKALQEELEGAKAELAQERKRSRLILAAAKAGATDPDDVATLALEAPVVTTSDELDEFEAGLAVRGIRSERPWHFGEAAPPAGFVVNGVRLRETYRRSDVRKLPKREREALAEAYDRAIETGAPGPRILDDPKPTAAERAAARRRICERDRQPEPARSKEHGEGHESSLVFKPGHDAVLSLPSDG